MNTITKASFKLGLHNHTKAMWEVKMLAFLYDLPNAFAICSETLALLTILIPVTVICTSVCAELCLIWKIAFK